MSTVDNPVDRPLVCDQMCAEIDRANSDLGAALVAARAEVERMRLVFDAARLYRQAHRAPCSGSGMDEARVVLFAAVDGLLPFPAPRKQCPDALEVDGGGSFVRCVRDEHPVGEEHFSRGRQFAWRATSELSVAEVVSRPHVPISPPKHHPVEVCGFDGNRWPCPGAPTQTGSAPQDVPQVSADEPGRGGHATSGPSNQPTESVS